MPYDQSVRTMMNNAGLDNSKIGYDGNSGYVTYGGQNFMKPSMNVNGTAYSDQATFDSAHNQYKQTNPSQTGQTNTGQPTTTNSQYGQGQGQSYTNPYTQQIADIMKHLTATSQTLQQPVDVYSSQQYAAAQAQQQRLSQQNIRQSQEGAAGAGLGHSTIMTDRNQRIQNDSDSYLQTQLVPAIMSQLQAQKQQEFQNQQAMFGNVFSLSSQADNQHNNDRNFDAGRQDAATAATGYYNPSGLTYEQAMKQMDENSAAYNSSDAAGQKYLHEKNLELAAMLGKTYDPATGTYSQGNGQAGTRTVQGQQLDHNIQTDQRNFEYKQARDQIADEQYKQKFDEDNRRYGLDYALKKAVEYGQLQISQQNANTSAASASASTQNAKDRLSWDKDPKNPDNRYKESEIAKNNRPAAKTTDYKSDPEFSQDIAHLKANPNDAKLLDTNAQEFIDKYTYDGYLALRKAAGIDN